MLYLYQDARGNLLLLRGQREPLEEELRLADRERSDLANISAVDADRPRFRTQTGSFAVGTSRIAAIFAQHDAHVQLVFLALEKAKKPWTPRKEPWPSSTNSCCAGGQLPPGRVERDAMLAAAFLSSAW